MISSSRLFYKKWLKRFFWFVFILLTLFLGLKLQYETNLYKQEFRTNSFLQEDGLFSFSYRNDYEVRENLDVYYVRSIVDEELVFQIFEEKDFLFFDDYDYVCDQGICYSKIVSDEIVMDLKILPGPHENRFEMLTRAEALEWLLSLKHSDVDFAVYAADCFDDVSASHPLSGYVCYSKQNEIVTGIDNRFYPESSINIWGFLKILFSIFEMDDYSFDESQLDLEMFDLMTEYHFAYELIAKALHEGILENVSGGDVWPNRAVYEAEAQQIVANFFAWQEGQVLRNYKPAEAEEIKSGNLYLKNPEWEFDFIELPSEDFLMDFERDFKWIRSGDVLELYVEEEGGIYNYLCAFPGFKEEDFKDVLLSYDEEHFAAGILFVFKNGEELYYKLTVANDDFAYLMDGELGVVEDPNVLPNKVLDVPPSGIAPTIEIFLSQMDFESLMENRTATDRYPAYVLITYPNGTVNSFSALIKTRGNASRGYAKSSYTIESFTPLDGDAADFDFLAGADEFKLRASVADETMMKEKLVYYLFEQLGHLSPKFGDATVEINGIPFGFYQLTEAVNDRFFSDRDIDSNYFYASNMASPYLANLTYFEDEDIVSALYDIEGNDGAEEQLLQLMYRLKIGDENLKKEINQQNIFDYAFVVFAMNLYDSLNHNYYLYQDEGLWNFFPWDSDAAFSEIPQITKENFQVFLQNHEGSWNALVWFAFDEVSDEEFDLYWNDLMLRLKDVDLLGKLDGYLEKYAAFYEYDAAIWSGLHLDLEEPFGDPLVAIELLREKLLAIHSHLVKILPVDR